MTIPIYIAGGFLEKDLIASYMRRLEKTGLFKITCDWTKSESAVPGKTSDAQLSDEEQLKFAQADLAGVSDACVIWHIVASYKGSRGAYVELGYAIACKRATWFSASYKVIASGADVRKTIFHALCDERFAEHEQAFDWLVSEARRGLL